MNYSFILSSSCLLFLLSKDIGLNVESFSPSCVTINSSIQSLSSSSTTASTTTMLFEKKQNDNISRKDLFKQLSTFSSATMLTILSTTSNVAFAAAADDELTTTTTTSSSNSATSSTTTSNVKNKAALRYIKRSIKEFESLELYASTNDYSEIKQGLRNPGLSEIRKNCNTLIKSSVEANNNGDGNGNENNEKLSTLYSQFIKDIEKLDGDASLGFRGRKGIELYPSYEQAVKDLKLFQEEAEKLLVPVDAASAVIYS